MWRRWRQSLWEAFQDADWDGGGELSTEELFAWFGEPVTAFSKTIFRLADMDDSGMLDFPEFVKVLEKHGQQLYYILYIRSSGHPPPPSLHYFFSFVLTKNGLPPKIPSRSVHAAATSLIERRKGPLPFTPFVRTTLPAPSCGTLRPRWCAPTAPSTKTTSSRSEKCAHRSAPL